MTGFRFHSGRLLTSRLGCPADRVEALPPESTHGTIDPG
jgi:hypothetical protein